MLGYWLVVATTLVALAGVVLVAVAQPDEWPSSGTPTRPLRIAVIGASDVTGDGLARPDEQNWVSQLVPLLPGDVEVRPFGVGGAWLASAESAQIAPAQAWEPDIVVCWFIVNDLTQGESLGSYLQRLSQVIGDFQAGGAIVIVGNAPQLWTLPAFAGSAEDALELQREVEQWNAAVAAVIAEHDAVLVDLADEPVSAADVLADGLHPNPSGHARLAGQFAPAILAAIDQARAMRLNAAASATATQSPRSHD